MRLPSLRFCMRTLMIAVAVVGVVPCLFVLDHVYEERGIGTADISLSFLVRDDQGQPVNGALIDLQDPDYLAYPREPEVLALRTGADGQVAVPLSLKRIDVRTLSGRLHVDVCYPSWQLKVSAQGYEPFVADFCKYAGYDPRFQTGSDPPPVEVRLRKRGGLR